MILTGGLGYGGGLVARGYGARVGSVAPPVVLPVPTAYGARSHDGSRRRRRLNLRLPDKLLPEIVPPLIPGDQRGHNMAVRARADREDELSILMLF